MTVCIYEINSGKLIDTVYSVEEIYTRKTRKKSQYILECEDETQVFVDRFQANLVIL